MKNKVVTMLVCAAFGVAHDAAAQTTWADRGYINVGFGVESGSSSITGTRTSTIYDEAATVTSSSSFSSGSLFDIGAGLRVWKNLTAGVSYHQEQNDSEGAITGSIPSPLFFNRPRTLSVAAAGLERKEQGTHIQIGWVVPVGQKFDILVSAGPSFFRLQQDVVSSVTPTEIGAPFTSVTAQVGRETRKKSEIGYNVGADVSYLVWQNDSVRLGGGMFFRYTQATMQILGLSTEQDTDVGGMQIGFGARIRF